MGSYLNGIPVAVAPATHEATHVSGGSDDIDSALAPITVALTTRGDTVYQDVSGLQRLPKGTDGQYLKIGASDPIWADVAAGVSDPHGAGQHSDVTRYMFLPALEARLGAGTVGAILYYGIVIGAANASEPVLQFVMKVPDDFVSFTSVKLVWSSTAASGNMYWRIQANWASATEAQSTHQEDLAAALTATGGANILNVQEPSNALSLTNLAVGDYIGFNAQRYGADGSDTLDTGVNWFGLLFTYTAHQ